MNMKQWLAFATFAWLCTTAVAEVRFTIADLGWVTAVDLNNEGAAVVLLPISRNGLSGLWDGTRLAYLPLSSLPAGYYASLIYAENDTGQLAGLLDDGYWHSERLETAEAAFWAEGAGQPPILIGRMKVVGVPAHLSASGHVLLDHRPDNLPAIWSASTGVQALPTLGGYTEAYGINDSDLVVGYSITPDGLYHAVTWEDGHIHPLDSGTWQNSQASAVANDGWIAGRVWSQDVYQGHLALWSPTGTLQTFTFSRAVGDVTAINMAHQATGRAVSTVTFGETFLFEDGKLSLLKDLVPAGTPIDSFDGALDLNNKGQILLTRKIPTTPDPDGPGYRDTVILTPIPPVARAFSFVNGQHKDASVRAAGRKRFVDAIRLAREASGLR